MLDRRFQVAYISGQSRKRLQRIHSVNDLLSTSGVSRMQARAFVGWSVRLLVAVLVIAASTRAQYTANIQGNVSDPSGSAVAQAKVALENLSTHVSATTTTDDEGGYRLLSMVPGSSPLSGAGSRLAVAR